MLCYNEKCQGKLKCIESRHIALGHVVHRRYECPVCGERFSTLEKRVVGPEPKVMKPVFIEKRKPSKKKPAKKEPIKLIKKEPVKPIPKEPDKPVPSHEEIRWRLTHPGMQWPGPKGGKND